MFHNHQQFILCFYRIIFDNRRQEKNERLDKQVAELRCQLQAKSKETGSGKTMWSAQTLDLQPQIYDLRRTVNDLQRRNEQLEIQLNQKQLEIEEQDRAMREQVNVLRVRDEVIALLKGRPDSRGNNDNGVSLPIVKKKNPRDREQVHPDERSTVKERGKTVSNSGHFLRPIKILVKRSVLPCSLSV